MKFDSDFSISFRKENLNGQLRMANDSSQPSSEMSKKKQNHKSCVNGIIYFQMFVSMLTKFC